MLAFPTHRCVFSNLPSEQLYAIYGRDNIIQHKLYFVKHFLVGAGIARPMPAGTNNLDCTLSSIELGRAMPAPTVTKFRPALQFCQIGIGSVGRSHV